MQSYLHVSSITVIDCGFGLNGRINIRRATNRQFQNCVSSSLELLASFPIDSVYQRKEKCRFDRSKFWQFLSIFISPITLILLIFLSLKRKKRKHEIHYYNRFRSDVLIIRSREIQNRKQNNLFLFFFFRHNRIRYQSTFPSCVKRDIRVSQRKKERNKTCTCIIILSTLVTNVYQEPWNSHIGYKAVDEGVSLFDPQWQRVVSRKIWTASWKNICTFDRGRGDEYCSKDHPSLSRRVMVLWTRCVAIFLRQLFQLLSRKITNIIPLCCLFYFFL